METVLLLDKPIAVTPLQLIKKFQETHPDYQNERLGYAGRLDPMAEGLVLVLIGDENKKRKAYEQLPKTYEFSVLFGVGTDTYDQMGLVTAVDLATAPTKDAINRLLPHYVGKHTQAYPPFSAARVDGKPLYYWARAHKLDEITIPEKQIEVHSLTLIDIRHESPTEVIDKIITHVMRVEGEFRQPEIVDTWKKLKTAQQAFHIADLEITCSSGTYVRSIAHQLGQDLGCPSIALRIKRTSVGPYSLTDAHTLDI